MSLDKAIKHGKEKRKPYYGCKAFDNTCRNHGSDDYMKENRLHKNRKRLITATSKLQDFEWENGNEDYC